MKKCLLILTTVLFSNSIHSQVLYTENFDNLSIGNLGTNFTGTIPGQGGWLTECYSTGTGTQCQNNLFNIISEVNKGNVLTLSAGTTNPTYVSLVAKKIGLQTLINQRTPGNNVLKLEIDYYTGAQLHGSVTYSQQIVLSYDANNNVFSFNNRLAYFAFWSSTGRLDISSKDHKAPDSLSGSILPFNTWVTFIVYLDYNNKKAYFEVPYLNKIAAADFFKNSTSVNLIEDFKPTALGLLYTAQNQTPSLYLVNKYDN